PAAERRAAQAILSIGGKIRVEGSKSGQFAKVEDLPATPFQIVDVNWYGNKQVGDAHLKLLSNLPWLRAIDVAKTNVSDAGLAELKGLVILESLNLSGT